MGRVYSIFHKPTGHHLLWKNDIAWPGGANNKLGWWLWIGGIEYTYVLRACVRPVPGLICAI